MEKYKMNDLQKENGNKLYGDLYIRNTNIKIEGKNNIIYINGNVFLENSSIEFRGDNSLIYICETDDKLNIDVKIYNNSTFYMGKNNWTNKGIKIVISEETNVFFGNDNLISYDTCIRTGDPHILYDAKTHKRINPSRSVYIGDHVWIGQHVYFLKGAQIGSGSVIGAMSLVGSKKYKSNCAYGGNPIKKLKENIFFLKDDCHRFTKKEKEEYGFYKEDTYIYEKSNETLNFDDIEKDLNNLSVEERVNYLNNITDNKNKNRFYIGD